jgi:hypothetical protein
MIEFLTEDNSFVQNIDISDSSDFSRFHSKEPVLDSDPFNITEVELKKVQGLGNNFRRKMSRELSKRFN